MEFTIKNSTVTVGLNGKNGQQWDVPLARAICADYTAHINGVAFYYRPNVSVEFDIQWDRKEGEGLEACIARNQKLAQERLEQKLEELWTLERNLKILEAARAKKEEPEED